MPLPKRKRKPLPSLDGEKNKEKIEKLRLMKEFIAMELFRFGRWGAGRIVTTSVMGEGEINIVSHNSE